MLYIQTTGFAALLLCALAQADDVSDRAKLIGSWQRQEDSATAASVWLLEMKGAALHITESLGDHKISEFECRPSGTDCEGTVEGKKASVSMYYDGPVPLKPSSKRRGCISTLQDSSTWTLGGTILMLTRRIR
jgi:hypothetical protein